MDVPNVGRLFATCAVVAIVLFALATLGRYLGRGRLLPGRGGPLITVLETSFLPNAASLHVVRVAERYFVIARSGGHIAALCELAAESLAIQSPASLGRSGRRRNG